MTGLERRLTVALERLSAQYEMERRRQSEQVEALQQQVEALGAAGRAAGRAERSLAEASRAAERAGNALDRALRDARRNVARPLAQFTG